MKRYCSIRIEQELFDRVATYSEKQKMTITEVITRCIEKQFGVIEKEIDKKKTKQFTDIEDRLDDIEERLNRIESRFD